MSVDVVCVYWPLASNDRLLCLCYSGFQPLCDDIITVVFRAVTMCSAFSGHILEEHTVSFFSVKVTGMRVWSGYEVIRMVVTQIHGRDTL
jgi:hypothetical protein